MVKVISSYTVYIYLHFRNLKLFPLNQLLYSFTYFLFVRYKQAGMYHNANVSNLYNIN